MELGMILIILLFLAAIQANLGCASLLADYLEAAGLSREAALERIWLFDSK